MPPSMKNFWKDTLAYWKWRPDWKGNFFSARATTCFLELSQSIIVHGQRLNIRALYMVLQWNHKCRRVDPYSNQFETVSCMNRLWYWSGSQRLCGIISPSTLVLAYNVHKEYINWAVWEGNCLTPQNSLWPPVAGKKSCTTNGPKAIG